MCLVLRKMNFLTVRMACDLYGKLHSALILLYHIRFTIGRSFLCVNIFCTILNCCLPFSRFNSVLCKEMWEYGYLTFICICLSYSNFWESLKRYIWNKAVVIYYKVVSQYTSGWLRKTTTLCHRCFQPWNFLPRT